MICNKCGAQNNEGTKFCMKCGNSFLEQEIQSQVQPQFEQQVQSQSGQQNQFNNSNLSTAPGGHNINKFDFRSFFKKNVKVIGIIAIIIVIAFVIIFGYKILFKNSLSTAISKTFDLEKPIPVKKDDLYGFINTSGKFIIEPIYAQADSFNGDYAIVAMEPENSEEDLIYYVIDKKGDVKAEATSKYDIEYISEFDIWVVNSSLFDGNLKKISSETTTVEYEDYGYLSFDDSSNNTAGIMNYKGKKTYTYTLKDDMTYFGVDISENDSNLSETYCKTIVDNEYYGIVNCDTGKVIYDYTEKWISVEDNNIFALYVNNDTYEKEKFMYIQENKVLYETPANGYEVEVSYYSDGYLEISDDTKDYDEKYSYFDLKTKKVTDERPASETILSDLSDWELLTGYLNFECANGYGLMENDKVILSCNWESIDYLSNNLYEYLKSEINKEIIVLEKSGKTILFDVKNQKEIITFNSTYISDYSGSTFIKAIDSDNEEIVIYNFVTNKSMKFDSKSNVTVSSNYMTITEDKVTKYYNVKLELIYTEKK